MLHHENKMILEEEDLNDLDSLIEDLRKTCGYSWEVRRCSEHILFYKGSFMVYRNPCSGMPRMVFYSIFIGLYIIHSPEEIRNNYKGILRRIHNDGYRPLAGSGSDLSGMEVMGMALGGQDQYLLNSPIQLHRLVSSHLFICNSVGEDFTHET